MDGSGFTDKLYFVLKENGKGFGIEFNGRKLVASAEKPIDAGSFTWLEWADFNHNNYFMEDASIWRLQPMREKQDGSKYKFIISLPYGEKAPRLKPNVVSPPLFSKLMATTRDNDGYNMDAHVLWDIVRN